MKIKTNATWKPQAGFKACTDSSGIEFNHGDYFTPNFSECNRCLCNNGRAENCIMLQCQKPTCEHFERVPGTCCEYSCSKDFVLTDKSTAAVVASLSIILVVILVAISLVWRQIKKKEKYGQRFETISSTSSQQETDIDSLIQRHSIPNNIRHTQTTARNKDTAKSPLLLSEQDNMACSSSSSPHHKTSNRESSNSNLSIDSSSPLSTCKHTNLLVALTDTPPPPQREESSCKPSITVQQMKRFEPPPPYTPPPDKVSFV